MPLVRALLRASWVASIVTLATAAAGQDAAAPPSPPEPAPADGAKKSQISEEARDWFRRGVEFLGDVEGSRYEDAYHAFKKAYELSHSPKILGNMGLCAMKLERDGEAIAAYKRYLDLADDIQPDERAQIEHDVKLLEGAAKLELRVEPEGSMVLDERVPVQGERVRNQYGPVSGAISLRLRPGTHHLVVKNEGYADGTLDIELEPGAKTSRDVVLAKPTVAAVGDKPDAPKGPLPAGAFAALGVTLALGVGAGVTGGLALQNHRKYSDAINAGDQPGADDLASKGKTLNTVADVLFGVTGAGAVTTIVLFAVLPRGPVSPDAPGKPAMGARLYPTAGPGLAGFGLGGSF